MKLTVATRPGTGDRRVTIASIEAWYMKNKSPSKYRTNNATNFNTCRILSVGSQGLKTFNYQCRLTNFLEAHRTGQRNGHKLRVSFDMQETCVNNERLTA